MATHPLFRSFNAASRNMQNILEDHIVQLVKIHGIDCYYVPKESEAISDIMGDSRDAALRNAYPIEGYLTRFDGFDGPNELVSRFGFSVQSSTVLVVTARSFKQFVGVYRSPREGDLIYIPVFERLFEITKSDPDVNFYQLGRKASEPMYWELSLETFRYSQENIDTGIEDIDIIDNLNSRSIQLHLTAGTGNFMIGEEVYQGTNVIVSTASAKVSDWDAASLVLTVINVRGEFVAGTDIVGALSLSVYGLNDYDDKEDHVPDDLSDNSALRDNALIILNSDETNPLANTTAPTSETDGLADDDGFLLIPD